jgi:AcrR family transcriptional regulator
MADSGIKKISPDLSVKTPTLRKQERSTATRQELIDAARRIFARDGFEAARVQDIAAAMGKTRGAFYSHFQDKEDVFFAIFEEDIVRDQIAYISRLCTASTLEERIAILVKQLEAITRDKARVLLYIEFKMYAIRRPHKRKRLADLTVLMCTHGAAAVKLDLLPELHSDDPNEQRSRTAQFGSFLDGLVLNHYFDPVGLDEERMRQQIESGVRSLMGPGSSWRKATDSLGGDVSSLSPHVDAI